MGTGEGCWSRSTLKYHGIPWELGTLSGGALEVGGGQVRTGCFGGMPAAWWLCREFLVCTWLSGSRARSAFNYFANAVGTRIGLAQRCLQVPGHCFPPAHPCPGLFADFVSGSPGPLWAPLLGERDQGPLPAGATSGVALSPQGCVLDPSGLCCRAC